MTDAVVGFVLEKLESLLVHEANLFRRVKGDVNLLRDDLGIMNAFLKDSEGKGDGQEMVEVLIGLIREAAFEAEDVTNTYMAQVIKQRRRKLPMKLFHCFDQALVLHRVAKKTQSIKRSIENIYANKTTFGIEAQSHVDEEAEQSLQQRRRNVEEEDVVGFGNDSRISLSTSRLKQITTRGNFNHRHERGILLLRMTVWKPQFWDEIRACFPNDSNGSRILITSREKKVASNVSSAPPYFLIRKRVGNSYARWCFEERNVLRIWKVLG
ncbi:hypothetical protein FEM48_Zijuj07G0050400 [Ziziphus jujuba var. spinosa]|uniref:Rx N-terminal domain-containing protein n=1 Tax=Ziziphus jujuba var. spinosa TaxID=714518 RepID=A0A978V2L7_ZIZJJ|nr:hypothetical protein FEM48_Zijuj07G0050400 [Ziziphus jujuba var. spinosa]